MAISDLDIARGTASGKESGTLYGFSKDITADWTDVWPASSVISWQTGAEALEIISTDAADASDGLGCRSVRITGLDAAGAVQTEVIATNGITAVPSVLTYLRVNSFEVVDVGTYGATHQGDITCRVASAGAIRSVMTGRLPGARNDNVNWGSGVADNGVFSVPAGKAMYITGGRAVGTYAADNTVYSLMHRPGLTTVAAPFRAAKEIYCSADQTVANAGIKPSGDVFDFSSSPIRIEPLSDFWVRASSGGGEMSVIINYYLTTA